MEVDMGKIERFEKKKAILIRNRELAEQRLFSAVEKYKKLKKVMLIEKKIG